MSPFCFPKEKKKKEIPIGNYCINLVRRFDNYTIAVSQFQSTSLSRGEESNVTAKPQAQKAFTAAYEKLLRDAKEEAFYHRAE